MKKGSILTLIGFILFLSSVNAQDYQTALGVRLSSSDAVVNNSVSFKHFFKSTALEVLFSFGDPVAIGALLERHKSVGPAGLYWFYGAGAYVGFGDKKNVGGQGIVGLDYKFSEVPINLSLDWKPELNLFQKVAFEPSAIGLSVRFTFK